MRTFAAEKIFGWWGNSAQQKKKDSANSREWMNNFKSICWFFCWDKTHSKTIWWLSWLFVKWWWTFVLFLVGWFFWTVLRCFSDFLLFSYFWDDEMFRHSANMTFWLKTSDKFLFAFEEWTICENFTSLKILWSNVGLAKTFFYLY